MRLTSAPTMRSLMVGIRGSGRGARGSRRAARWAHQRSRHGTTVVHQWPRVRRTPTKGRRDGPVSRRAPPTVGSRGSMENPGFRTRAPARTRQPWMPEPARVSAGHAGAGHTPARARSGLATAAPATVRARGQHGGRDDLAVLRSCQTSTRTVCPGPTRSRGRSEGVGTYETLNHPRRTL